MVGETTPVKIVPVKTTPAKTLVPGSGNKWMKFAAILGFIFFAYGAISLLLGVFGVSIKIPCFLSEAITIGFLILSGFYLYGFVQLAKKTDSKMLKIVAITGIVIIAIGIQQNLSLLKN